MKFRYSAKTKEGETQTGFVEAGNRDAAVNILMEHNLFILSLKSAETARWYDRVSSYLGGVKRKDMLVFTRQLATLLEARIALNEALKMLSEQVTNRVMKEGVAAISHDIDSGLSFSQALGRQSTVFSEFFTSMVRSAEVTGNVDEIVGFLADYYEKEFVLMRKSRSAMIYPAVVVGLFVVVAIVMVTFVFPQLEPLFSESGVELPFFTRALIGTSRFVGAWWPLLFLGFAVLVSALMSYFRTAEGKGVWDEAKIRAPIIKKVYIPLSVARFSNAASILLKGGVPVAQAMEIVSHTVDNTVYRDLLHEAAEAVREGETLSRAIAKHPEYFPVLLSQMLVVGETTGEVDKVFARIANFYNREADTIINNLVDLIQPLLIITLGAMVAILFASILLPIFELTSRIA